MDLFIFLTELMHKNVYGADGRRYGRVVDFTADTYENYPRVGSFICRPKAWARRGARRRVPWEAVARLEPRGIYLTPPGGQLVAPFERRANEVLLVEDVLDKQIVDVNGAKVERVNDIHFLNTDNDLRVAHADVGFRGLLRRLGVLRFFDAATGWLFSYTVKENLIPWRFVQPVAELLAAPGIQLNVARQRLATIHPADLADIIEELPQPGRAAVFQTLDVETAAETLEEVEDADLQVDLLETVGAERAGDIIEEMDPDEAADVLHELDEGQAATLIAEMEDERADDLRELLAHDEGTAGAIMTTEYLTATPKETAAGVLRRVRRGAGDIEAYTYIYVVGDGDFLTGVLSLRDVLTARGAVPVGGLMEKRVIAVRPDDRVAVVIELFGKYGFATVPVTDDQGVLHGVITLHDAVAAAYPDFVKD